MNEQTNTEISKHFYRAPAADFMKIPGSPLAYWLSRTALNAFVTGAPLTDFADPRVGLDTGDNESFIRFWHEVDFNQIGFNYKNAESFLKSNKFYVPHTKGGDFKKWYGNFDYVIKFNKPAYKALAKQGNKLPSKQFYFMPGASWTRVSSAKFSIRFNPAGFVFNSACPTLFSSQVDNILYITGVLLSPVSHYLLEAISPTINFQAGDIRKIPIMPPQDETIKSIQECICITQKDWDSYETSWDFKSAKLINQATTYRKVYTNYLQVKDFSDELVNTVRGLEKTINTSVIKAYNLHEELNPAVPLTEITLNCNPHYRYGGNLTDQEREDRLQSDTIAELVSYGIGCVMGRYSLDKEGLILASQGETIQDYLAQIPNPSFMPDEDAIIPLTDEEWFPDDATNLVRDFIRTVWGEETLQENLDFVAESLCLHAIRARKSETALEAIRRYLSTQFYKDHMRTYKKRPIYWLFSSGKQKAFECLVYLHRYNESTLSRMRTEYVTQLMGKYESQINHLEEQLTQASTSEKTKLNRVLRDYHAKLNELREFDNKLKHYADMRIALDLDDGVKENYGKFGDLLANVRDITGKKPKVS